MNNSNPKTGNPKPAHCGPSPKTCFRLSILFVTALLAFTACGGGGGGAPLPEGPTTLAYAVSECRQEKTGQAFLTRQVLYVRQGDGEPRPVMEFGEVGPKPNNLHCYELGLERFGFGSPELWPLQRLGVSRDGSLVVFEVTDDFSLFSQSQVQPPLQKGIYVVYADGSGLRRLGPASRAPCFNYNGIHPCFFGFSPNGRTVTYTDLDSALPQLDAPQVFTLDVGTGEATQLTHLSAAPTAPTGFPASYLPQFLDAETITFYSYANPATQDHPNGANPDPGALATFTVKTDGTGLESVPVIVLPGGASSQTSRSPAPNPSL